MVNVLERGILGKFIDKTGQRYNSLTVQKYLEGSNWLCLCDCGNTTIVKGHLLNEIPQKRKVKSCGCLKEKNKPANENFFEKIDTEEQAYVLGFICADGCCQPELHRIKIDLKETDEDILIKIQQAIGHTNKLSHYHETSQFGEIDISRLVIHSQKILDDLENLGVGKNKTYSLLVDMNKIPKKFFKHFLRGMFDGDGCISFGKNYQDVNITINSKMAEMLKNKISEELKEDRLYKTIRHKERPEIVTLLATNTHYIYNFLNYLYKDSNIYLNRKYDLYLKYKEKYEGINCND